MSKKRPGVEAAKRLLQSSDESLWQRVESQSEYVNVMVSNTPSYGSSVPDLHWLRSKLTKPQKGKGQNRSTTSSSDDDSFFLTKEELLKVVEWKFAVGKPRYALMKYLHSNSNAIVQQHTQRALSFANEIPKVTEQNHNHSNDDSNDDDDDNNNNSTNKNLKEAAMNELTQHLKGVGPATASAILTLVRPDVFCYLYDEAIDCFLPKRTYTHKVYETVNQKCTKIAKRLSSSSSSSSTTHWTTARVAKTLWVAARICAVGEKEDYTLSVVRKPSNTTKTKNREEEEEEEIQDATSSLLDATNKTNNNANRKNKRKRRNSP